MNKLFFFLMIAVFITGCQGLNRGGTIPDSSAAYLGTEGLVMKFMENAPPPIIPSQSYVPVGFFFENKGAVDIVNGVVVVRYPEDMMMLDSNRISINVEGKETILAGGRQVTILDGLTKNPEKIGTEKPKARIAATSCYDYTTKLSTGICVNPDSYGIRKVAGKKPVCESKVLTFGGQGAPVAITKVEPLTLARGDTIDVQIKAYVANKNNGVIYRKGTTYCTSQKTGKNSVFVRAALLGRDVSCSPGELILSDRSEENYVTCTFTSIAAQEAFITQLSVVAEYGYSQTISKDFSIDPVQATCVGCGEDGYIGLAGSAQCQYTKDGSFLTATHKKCYKGCEVFYPDYTTNPPTAC